MKVTVYCFVACWILSPGHLQAAESDSVQVVVQAAQRLAEQDNYSWVSTSQSAPGTRTWRQGPTKGKTEKNGCTYVSFTLGDNTISMAFKGTNAAINWADTWQGADELAGEYAWIGQRLKTYKPPAQEALFLTQNTENLHPRPNGTLSGALNPAALKWILSRGRQEFTEIPRMNGTVTFHLRNGQLAQYDYKLEGVLPLSPDQPEVPINRTTTVAIENVGNTQVTVPPEAAQKLQ